MINCQLDPFDRDHGPQHATPVWVVVALIGLILMAMAFNVVRAAGVSLGRTARGAPSLGEIGAEAARP
jgi:hypothetical protein